MVQAPEAKGARPDPRINKIEPGGANGPRSRPVSGRVEPPAHPRRLRARVVQNGGIAQRHQCHAATAGSQTRPHAPGLSILAYAAMTRRRRPPEEPRAPHSLPLAPGKSGDSIGGPSEDREVKQNLLHSASF